MAVRKDRVPENVPGKYYVDAQCIDCDVCRVTAPDNFQRSEDKGYSYLFRQPESPEAVALGLDRPEVLDGLLEAVLQLDRGSPTQQGLGLRDVRLAHLRVVDGQR